MHVHDETVSPVVAISTKHALSPSAPLIVSFFVLQARRVRKGGNERVRKVGLFFCQCPKQQPVAAAKARSLSFAPSRSCATSLPLPSEGRGMMLSGV